MATLYGKGRGKARSHSPKSEKPPWFSMKKEEVESLIVELAKKGVSIPKIGLILRDGYGVVSIKLITGKKIKKILEEKGIKMESTELIVIEKRIKALKKHLEKNKKDTRAKRGLQLTQAKMRRLKKYYKKKKK